MLHQHILHLIGADPVTACFDDIVKASVEPVAARCIPVGGVAGVVDTATPDMPVLRPIVQIPGEYAHLFPVFRGKNHHLADLPIRNGASLLIPQFNAVQGGNSTHGAFHRLQPLEICHEQGGFRLPVGRPQTTKDDVPAIFLRHYPAYKNGQLNITELSRVCDLSRTTIYKYISLLEA